MDFMISNKMVHVCKSVLCVAHWIMTCQGPRPRLQQTTDLRMLPEVDQQRMDNRHLNPTTTTEHQGVWHTEPMDAVFVGAAREDLDLILQCSTQNTNA